jgi:hypothetical protein
LIAHDLVIVAVLVVATRNEAKPHTLDCFCLEAHEIIGTIARLAAKVLAITIDARVDAVPAVRPRRGFTAV